MSHDAYRLPLPALEKLGVETRRAGFALSYLLSAHALSESEVRSPFPVTFADLGRVHDGAYLESLTEPAVLSRIFSVAQEELVVDEMLRSVRLACGGTLLAAQWALAHRAPALNCFGGFHHAGKAKGGGFCAVNDVAVAVAALRAAGFDGEVAVLDLDAHPPDGTADCLAGQAWLGSISGSDFGPLPGVDELRLPPGTGDAPYLEALDELLSRLPRAALTFVLAGGDVLAGDRLGALALSLNGARERDLRVARALEHRPSVWLPAGGYGPHAWKVLAGTALAIGYHSEVPVPPDFDPLAVRFAAIAQSLPDEALGAEPMLTADDVAEALGHRRPQPAKLLGFYTAQGMELALERYGLLPHLRRLGYAQVHVELAAAGGAERARVVALDERSGESATLVELDVERKALRGGTFLFVNWLAMRHPRAQFSGERPRLPGQDAPGLGLSREMTQLLVLMSERLKLDGVAFRPSWFHMAYAARHTARFLDPARQGRFEALCRDSRELPLLEATRAVAEGRVQLNGAPYTWEPDEMVQFRDPAHVPDDRAQVQQARDASHFTLQAL
ncbi:MAG: histone deacetylase [Myxococcaceae bacterium]|nr:histone deacetylase [Myxococcaceae bacterium]